MKKSYVAALYILLSFNCLAESDAYPGQKWIGPYTIDKVSFYTNPAYYTFTVHVKENVNSTCAVTNNQKKFFHGNGSSTDFVSKLYSVGATAQAQGKKVMLLSTTTCNPKFGMAIDGVEILSD
ncbi:hypothetical protein PD716_22135 [Vibrio gigantis]|uniref:Uncharacterized protein n=1 Tax=Vibrio splendidus TaxID=29497 RepID=A0A2T5DWC8_VIBSP|nr:hypothetical protein [Vibrio splendidus]OEE61663.1 hypothetical protein A147_20305 [Vibrio splendidus FF-6]PTP11384.1 hypothetical protein CWO36_25010 [Vibrio splendidus]